MEKRTETIKGKEIVFKDRIEIPKLKRIEIPKMGETIKMKTTINLDTGELEEINRKEIPHEILEKVVNYVKI